MESTRWITRLIAGAILASIFASLSEPFRSFLEWSIWNRIILFVVIVLLVVISDVVPYIRQKLITRRKRILGARISFKPYVSEIEGEREAGLIIYNNERKLEMLRFEVYHTTLNSDDLDEQQIDDIRQRIGRSTTTKRYSWRVGDSNKDGMVRIEAKNGYRELVIARTDQRSNTFSLIFNDGEVSGIPSGIYKLGLGARGRMPQRQAGLYSYAVEIRYIEGRDIRIREISPEEANIHILR